jgi:hypothetical protein
MLAHRLECGGRLARENPVEDGDLALLARAGGRGEFPGAGKWRLGLVTAAQQLLGAGERDMAERETLVGLDRLLEKRIGPGRRRQQAVDAGHVGVARRR